MDEDDEDVVTVEMPKGVTGLRFGADKPDSGNWAQYPRTFRVGGKEREFFTTQALAVALNRTSQTIRLWERRGVLPKTRYRTPNLNGIGGVRLYTRKQIEGIVRVAEEEGVLYNKVPYRQMVKFTQRITPLFLKED